MLVELAKRTVFLVRKWRHFGELVDSTVRGKVIFVVFGLVFFAISSIIFSLSAALMLNFPKIWATIIIACFFVSTMVLFSVPFMKTVFLSPKGYLTGKNAEICIGSMLIAALGFYLLIGVGLFSGTGWVSKVLRQYIIPEDLKFPLSRISGFDIDDNGRIYIAIQDYSRIQIYEQDGNFLSGFFVPSGGGVFHFWIKDDHINVVTSRTNKHLVFDFRGKLLRDEDISSIGSYKELSKYAAGIKEKYVDNYKYKISNQRWFPHVTKVTPEGEESVVLADPLYVCVFHKNGFLFVAVLCFMILCALWGLTIYFNIDLK